MTTLQKILNVILILAVVAIGYTSFAPHKAKLGDATVSNYPTWYYNGITIGPANDLVTQVLSGTVTCATGASSITALASTTVDCAVSNVLPGDQVFVSLPASTPASIGKVGAYASTTASGYFELVLFNYATTTKAIAGATSSVQYIIVR